MAFEKVGVRAVIEGLGRFNRDTRLINKRLREVTGNVEKLEKKSRNLTASLEKLSPGFRKAGLALTALGAAGAVFLFKATKLAARVETLGVVTEVLGRNVGKTKDEIRALEKAVADQGITLRAARTSIALMIQSNIDLSNAVNLAAEAQNAAVIAGVDSSEAFQRLVFTITSGNVRMARTLGLQVSFQEAYEKTAESLGKTTLELTQQEKIQARTAEVLKAGTRIVGAYDAAMETAGKKVFSLNRHIENVTVIMGEQFIPIFGDAIDALTAFLEGIEEASQAQQRGIAATIAATTAVSGLSGATLLFLSLLPNLIRGMQALGIASAGLGGAIGLGIAALGVMIVGLVKAGVENKVLKKTFQDLIDVVVKENKGFAEYEKRAFEAAEGTSAYALAQNLSIKTGKSFDETLRSTLRDQGLLTREQFIAEQQTIRVAEAQKALRGALRGVGTSLKDQITDLKISELSYEDYTEEVEALAEANDLTVISQKEFTTAVRLGENPLRILERSVLRATERQFDLAKSAEASDRKLLGLLGTERDATKATRELAEKLGLTKEELLKVAEAAGIALDGLEELPEDFEIKIQAELDKQAQERIQSALDELQFTIDTRLSLDFEGFQEDLQGAEDALAELEIENIEKIAEIRAEGIEDLENAADRIDDLLKRRRDEILRLKELEAQLDLTKDKFKEMGDETDELGRRSQELQIDRLINDLNSQKESVGELTAEIAELRGGTADMVAATEQALSDQERIYQDQLQDRVKDIDEVTEAWSRQTKEIIFNLALQRFGIDGFTDEELDALTQLAGPEGLGLLDEAAVALLEGVKDVNEALKEPGNQAPIVVSAMSAMADSMIDPTLKAEDLAAAYRDIGAAILGISQQARLGIGPLLIQETIPGRQGGGSARRGQPIRVGEGGEEIFIPNQSGIIIPNSLTTALSSFLTAATSAIPIAGAGAPATAAGGGGTTQNFQMTVNTRAPVEQIAADFNFLALMGERRG